MKVIKSKQILHGKFDALGRELEFTVFEINTFNALALLNMLYNIYHRLTACRSDIFNIYE